GTTVEGDVVNTGTIKVDGGTGSTVTAGILVEGLSPRNEFGEILPGIEVATVIDGQLNNSGSIIAEGKSATGIHIGEGVILDSIVNSGTIQASSIGIMIEEGAQRSAES